MKWKNKIKNSLTNLNKKQVSCVLCACLIESHANDRESRKNKEIKSFLDFFFFSWMAAATVWKRQQFPTARCCCCPPFFLQEKSKNKKERSCWILSWGNQKSAPIAHWLKLTSCAKRLAHIKRERNKTKKGGEDDCWDIKTPPLSPLQLETAQVKSWTRIGSEREGGGINTRHVTTFLYIFLENFFCLASRLPLAGSAASNVSRAQQ